MKFWTVLFVGLLGLVVYQKFSATPEDTAGQQTSPSLADSVQPKPATAACKVGSAASGDVVTVTGDAELHTEPSADAPRIKNEKASAALGSVHYHQIDSSTTVRHLCQSGEWSEVQIVTPDWLNFVRGWVPNTALRGIARSGDGVRVYVEQDFYWDSDSSKYKTEIVEIANRIARDNDKCGSLDTASVALSPSRGGPGDPVFFVTCEGRGAPFNVWFRPGDAGKKMGAVRPISQTDATWACEAAAKAQATHPSTVDFSRILDVSYGVRGDGRVSLDSSFSAKNSFNLTLKYKIRCLFDGAKLIDVNISERG